MEDERDNPLECIICNKNLKQPVILPCGHTVCKAHEIERKKENTEIKCAECNESHQIPEGFLINRIVENLLRRKLHNIDLGGEHVKATSALKELSEFMKKMRHMKQNPESEINEIVSDLRNKIDLRRDVLKKRIDDEAQALIDELDEFERTNLVNHDTIDKIKQSSELLDTLLADLEKECSIWQKELRSFEKNEEKWMSIQNQCLSKIESLNVEYETFKEKIFDDRLFDFELKQTKFCLDKNEPLL